MRRRPTRAALVALCSLVFVVAGCGSSDDGDEGTSGTTSPVSTESDGSTTSAAEGGEAAAVDCDAYLTVSGLVPNLEDLAGGSNDRQVAAEEALATALEALAPAAEGDEELTAALDTIGQVSFQPRDTASGPSVAEVEDAVATLDEAWSSTCEAPIECPAPETLEAEGLQCDAEGNVTPIDEGGSTEEQPECPDAATLEAEGFTCDSEGNLVPIDEETVAECPSPETLEAEGFTCDSEGNLTPIEGAEELPPTEEPVECPAPEVLEAEGYTCDENGVLTPAE